ncbi:MAG: hypothetical protein WC812_04295 [Candidatus Pacearchaeota archaeon]|jgi:hypothetical protein
MKELYETLEKKTDEFQLKFLALLDEGFTEKQGLNLLDLVGKDYFVKKIIFSVMGNESYMEKYSSMASTIYNSIRQKLVDMNVDVSGYPLELEKIKSGEEK